MEGRQEKGREGVRSQIGTGTVEASMICSDCMGKRSYARRARCRMPYTYLVVAQLRLVAAAFVRGAWTRTCEREG